MKIGFCPIGAVRGLVDGEFVQGDAPERVGEPRLAKIELTTSDPLAEQSIQRLEITGLLQQPLHRYRLFGNLFYVPKHKPSTPCNIVALRMRRFPTTYWTRRTWICSGCHAVVRH